MGAILQPNKRVIVFQKASGARPGKIESIDPYDAKNVANAAWLQNLEDNGLSYVVVDNVTSTTEFARRKVDTGQVLERSDEASITEVKFPRGDKVVLTTPGSVKQGSTVRIEVAVKDPDEIGVKSVAGTVAYRVCYPDPSDIHSEGDISILAGQGYVDVQFPNLVTSGDGIKTGVLVCVQKDNDAYQSASAFVEMSL